MSESPFQTFDALLASDDTGAAIEFLIKSFTQEEKHHELFEAMKIRLRHKLGLPLTKNADETELSGVLQQQLEAGLLSACEQVGNALLESGKPREAWMYLRAVGSKAAVAEKLRSIPITDENIEQCIEVAFNETVDPAWGYELVLRHYGTCNGITTLGGYFPALDKPSRKAVAGVLVRHVYDELRSGIVANLERDKKSFSSDDSVMNLITEHENLLTGSNHHIDVSHLNSTLRFAEHVDEAKELQMAYEMSIYGSRLDRDLQFPGEPPFEDFFTSHSKYFGILLNWDEAGAAMQYFRQQAEQVDAHFQGTQAAEVYVDLLSRTGRMAEAQEALLRLIPPGTHVTGRAPTLMELCELSGDFSAQQKLSIEKGDLLQYAIAGLQQTAPSQPDA